jgi:putative membrane protein
MIPNYNSHAANERTFLAWVRTAIALIGFGLAAERLKPGTSDVWSELALMLSGAMVVVFAFIRMRALDRRIDAFAAKGNEEQPADTLLIGMIIALFATLAFFAVHVS